MIFFLLFLVVACFWMMGEREKDGLHDLGWGWRDDDCIAYMQSLAPLPQGLYLFHRPSSLPQTHGLHIPSPFSPGHALSHSLHDFKAPR